MSLHQFLRNFLIFWTSQGKVSYKLVSYKKNKCTSVSHVSFPMLYSNLGTFMKKTNVQEIKFQVLGVHFGCSSRFLIMYSYNLFSQNKVNRNTSFLKHIALLGQLLKLGLFYHKIFVNLLMLHTNSNYKSVTIFSIYMQFFRTSLEHTMVTQNKTREQKSVNRN